MGFIAVRPTEKQVTRFWDKVSSFDSATGCRTWLGAKSNTGYGNVRWSGRCLKAHRAAYIIIMGDIPEGLDILHSCDNRLCCEISHLRPGTDKENAADRDSRSRRKAPKGTLNGQALLTEAEVLEIRARYKAEKCAHKVLADEFGVSVATIRDVLHRVSWKHVGDSHGV